MVYLFIFVLLTSGQPKIYKADYPFKDKAACTAMSDQFFSQAANDFQGQGRVLGGVCETETYMRDRFGLHFPNPRENI